MQVAETSQSLLRNLILIGLNHDQQCTMRRQYHTQVSFKVWSTSKPWMDQPEKLNGNYDCSFAKSYSVLLQLLAHDCFYNSLRRFVHNCVPHLFLLVMSTSGYERTRYNQEWINGTSCVINLFSFNFVLQCTVEYTSHLAEGTIMFNVPLSHHLKSIIYLCSKWT